MGNKKGKGRGRDKQKRKRRNRVATLLGASTVAGTLGVGALYLTRKKKGSSIKGQPLFLPSGVKKKTLFDLKNVNKTVKRKPTNLFNKKFTRKENNSLVAAIQSKQKVTPLMEQMAKKAIKSEKERRAKNIIRTSFKGASKLNIKTKT
jgi:hypothetical protein